MAKKKTYYIPTTEIISLTPGWPVLIAGSGDHGTTPAPRRDPAF